MISSSGLLTLGLSAFVTVWFVAFYVWGGYLPALRRMMEMKGVDRSIAALQLGTLLTLLFAPGKLGWEPFYEFRPRYFGELLGLTYPGFALGGALALGLVLGGVRRLWRIGRAVENPAVPSVGDLVLLSGTVRGGVPVREDGGNPPVFVADLRGGRVVRDVVSDDRDDDRLLHRLTEPFQLEVDGRTVTIDPADAALGFWAYDSRDRQLAEGDAATVLGTIRRAPDGEYRLSGEDLFVTDHTPDALRRRYRWQVSKFVVFLLVCWAIAGWIWYGFAT